MKQRAQGLHLGLGRRLVAQLGDLSTFHFFAGPAIRSAYATLPLDRRDGPPDYSNALDAPKNRRPGKVVVVMPAMNAAATLLQTVDDIPGDWVDEVVLVDDHSTEETVRIAGRLPIRVVWHPHNAGYGANQKTCYVEVLQRGAGRLG